MKLLKRIKLNSEGFSHIELVVALAVIAIIASVGVHVLTSSHAASGVYPANTYTNVSMPANNVTDETYDLKINTVPHLGNAPYFWSDQFGFMSGPPLRAAYFGLQGINKAVFSVFDYASPEAPGCQVVTSGFDGSPNEPGTACLIKYTVTEGDAYHLEVIKISTNSKGNNWQASVKDITTNKTTVIGTINVSSSWGNLTYYEVAFSEYFGPTMPSCPTSTQSTVTFNNFTSDGGKYSSPSSHTDTYQSNSCTSNSKTTDNSADSYTQRIGR